MKILTTPWKNEFFELVTNSKKSIKITSPFIKKDIANEMLRIKSKGTKIELFTSFKLMNIYSGSLDIDAIQNIIDSDGIVRNYPRLHSKIYIFDDEKAIITSGNLTNGGLVKNFEYGAFIDETSLVNQICLDFNNLRLNEKTGIIKRKDLDLVREILNKIPKIEKVRIPDFEIETPEESYDIIETPLEPILNSLTGWKLEVFKCVNLLETQYFTLNEVNKFESYLKQIYPENKHITDKIRQQLQYLRDLGLIEFLGSGNYKKLWQDGN